MQQQWQARRPRDCVRTGSAVALSSAVTHRRAARAVGSPAQVRALQATATALALLALASPGAVVPPNRGGRGKGAAASAGLGSGAIGLASAVKVPFEYSCDGGTTVATVQVDDLGCGCLAARQLLVETVACFDSDNVEGAIENCIACSHRANCNCTLKALGLSPGQQDVFNATLFNPNNYCGTTYTDAASGRVYQCLDGLASSCPPSQNCYNVGELPEFAEPFDEGGGQGDENIAGVPKNFNWVLYAGAFVAVCCCMGLLTSTQEMCRKCREDGVVTKREQRHRRRSQDRLHGIHRDASGSIIVGKSRQGSIGGASGKSTPLGLGRRSSPHPDSPNVPPSRGPADARKHSTRPEGDAPPAGDRDYTPYGEEEYRGAVPVPMPMVGPDGSHAAMMPAFVPGPMGPMPPMPMMGAPMPGQMVPAHMTMHMQQPMPPPGLGMVPGRQFGSARARLQ